MTLAEACRLLQNHVEYISSTVTDEFSLTKMSRLWPAYGPVSEEDVTRVRTAVERGIRFALNRLAKGVP